MSANKLIPINLRLPQNLINESDQMAKREGSSRTELVRAALRSYIERRQRLRAVYNIVARRGVAAGINTLQDVEDALNQAKTKIHGK